MEDGHPHTGPDHNEHGAFDMAYNSMTPQQANCQNCGISFLRTARRQTCCSALCKATKAYRQFVIQRGDDECWGWSGFKHKGYGRLRYGANAIGAHRMSYLIHVGFIPNGLTVLHSCDNPECTNPRHLTVGTNADNNLNRDLKGRCATGETASTSVLTEEAVKDIRANYRRGVRGEVMKFANKYDVTRSTIYAVANYETWRHVA